MRRTDAKDQRESREKKERICQLEAKQKKYRNAKRQVNREKDEQKICLQNLDEKTENKKKYVNRKHKNTTKGPKKRNGQMQK